MLLLTDLPVPGVMQLASPDPETPIIFQMRSIKYFQDQIKVKGLREIGLKALTHLLVDTTVHTAIFIRII